jgi:hypothetical protein
MSATIRSYRSHFSSLHAACATCLIFESERQPPAIRKKISMSFSLCRKHCAAVWCFENEREACVNG